MSTESNVVASASHGDCVNSSEKLGVPPLPCNNDAQFQQVSNTVDELLVKVDDLLNIFHVSDSRPTQKHEIGPQITVPERPLHRSEIAQEETLEDPEPNENSVEFLTETVARLSADFAKSRYDFLTAFRRTQAMRQDWLTKLHGRINDMVREDEEPAVTPVEFAKMKEEYQIMKARITMSQAIEHGPEDEHSSDSEEFQEMVIPQEHLQSPHMQTAEIPLDPSSFAPSFVPTKKEARAAIFRGLGGLRARLTREINTPPERLK